MVVLQVTGVLLLLMVHSKNLLVTWIDVVDEAGMSCPARIDVPSTVVERVSDLQRHPLRQYWHATFIGYTGLIYFNMQNQQIKQR